MCSQLKTGIFVENSKIFSKILTNNFSIETLLCNIVIGARSGVMISQNTQSESENVCKYSLLGKAQCVMCQKSAVGIVTILGV